MKMKDIATPFKVGVLVIVGLAAAIFMISTVDDSPYDPDATVVRVSALLDDVTGLAIRSNIMVAGIPVGRLESIQLEGGKARVEMTVRIPLYEGEETATGFWQNGATVARKSSSLIGDMYLEVSPGNVGRQLVDGDEIKNVITPPGFDEMFDRFDRISGDIEEVTNSLAAVFGGEDGRQAIQQLVSNLEEILNTLNQFVGANSEKIDRILTDVEFIARDVRNLTGPSSESVVAILRDAESIIQEVRFVVGQSSADLQSGLGTLTGTLNRFQSTLDSLNYSLQNIQDITDKINEGQGTLGELVNNPVIAQRTEQILVDASDLIGSYSRLQTIIELRSEYHMRSGQLKNILGLRLQPTDDKYYLIELVDDYRGSTQIIQEDVSTTDSSVPDGVYRETRVTTTDTFKFSAQFAKIFRLSPYFAFGGRFGLIESSGGIGTNLLFLPDDRLQVQADLFDFSADINPRVRTFATYEFLRFLYVAGGIDDALNPNRREYFLGGGFRFNDKDLKALITATGVPSP